jgi:tellurium resistance protein TerD
MSVILGPHKGQSVELEYSEEGKQRILVGLQWDPPTPDWEKQSGTPPGTKRNFFTDVLVSICKLNYINKQTKDRDKEGDKDGRDHEYLFFDLDLYAFILDDNGQYIDMVGPENENMIEISNNIYHSGEDFSGHGGGDDEQIFVELKNIPDHYKNIILVVTSDSQYTLDEINGPLIRIADSKTNQDLIKASITPPPGSQAYAYFFANIYKNDDKWYLKNIDEYGDFAEYVDFSGEEEEVENESFFDQWKTQLESYCIK